MKIKKEKNTTEQKRRLLFKKSKPFIKPILEEDLWVLWAAYGEGSFKNIKEIKEGLSRDIFYKEIAGYLLKYSEVLLVEDNNKIFKGKRGPTCLIMIKKEGTRIEPSVIFFKWATTLNILRCNVRFFNWVKYNRQISVCVVRCLKGEVNLFHHVNKYGVIYYVGKIVNGDPLGRGDEYVFSTPGKFSK